MNFHDGQNDLILNQKALYHWVQRLYEIENKLNDFILENVYKTTYPNCIHLWHLISYLYRVDHETLVGHP